VESRVCRELMVDKFNRVSGTETLLCSKAVLNRG